MPLPHTLNSQDELRTFFGGMMLGAGALMAPGQAILSCRIAQVCSVWWVVALACSWAAD